MKKLEKGMAMFMALVMSLCVWSCGDNPDPSTLSVSTSNISVTADGGTQTISVTSNTNWSVTCPVGEVYIYPTSGHGNSTVQVTIPQTSAARTIDIVFKATLNGTTAEAIATASQSGNVDSGSSLTPGQHQNNLESVGLQLLRYFDHNDSRTLAESIKYLAESGGFDFYLEEPTRTASAKKSGNLLAELLASTLGITRFSPEAVTRLSTTIIFPEDEESYSIDDYKGKQYTFNYRTGKWTESSLGDVNKCVAKWGADVATLTWEESSQSWEGFVSYDYKAKVQNIPSKVNFKIEVGGTTEFTAEVTVSIPNNYAIDTKTAIWLKGGYNFSTSVAADRKGISGSVTIAKNGEKLAMGGGSVAINDMTDSNNWFIEDTHEYYDGYQWVTETYSEFNYEYPMNQVKTGTAYASILNIGLQVEGNLRTIIDQGQNIDDPFSYDGASLLSNYINSNASAVLYYLDNSQKIADIKAKPMPYEYKDYVYDSASGQYVEVVKTEYDTMPVLIFDDGSEFAVDNYFTETAFGTLLDAAKALYESYASLVE